MFRRMLVPTLALGLVAVVSAAPQQPAGEAIDAAMIAKIRAEGMDRSQVMRIEQVLTDVYGPRLTGTPNLENAGKWAIKEMESWGLKNGKMEPWNWGHEGWLNEFAVGHLVTPVRDNLVFEVLAWTPSTKGVVKAAAVNLIAPATPTQAQLDAYFASMAAKVKGAVVLVGAATVPAFVETEGAKRRADDQAKATYTGDLNAPAGAGRGRTGGAGAGRGAGAGAAAPAPPTALTGQQVNSQIAAFLVKSGAAIRVNDAARRHGQIIAFNAAGYDTTQANAIPTVVLRNEDYGRIARLLATNVPVTVEFNIQNKTFPDGKTSHNATAEIVGTDKADEVVMLGGHLDSWHSSTGATDNAIGCAIMMEAVRILQAVGAKPRRTIRVALWGGEEQGLLGSKAYVDQHFGTFENPKPEFAKFSAYWNIDSGTGLVRGASVFGPPAAAQVLRDILKPFEDFKVYGANPTTSRNTGGTDSTSFNAAGLAGIGTGQDGIEYNSHTHHTNLDAYERILPDDVKKNAVITAAVVYQLAMREGLMPRFDKDKMPAPPNTGRGGNGGTR